MIYHINTTCKVSHCDNFSVSGFLTTNLILSFAISKGNNKPHASTGAFLLAHKTSYHNNSQSPELARPAQSYLAYKSRVPTVLVDLINTEDLPRVCLNLDIERHHTGDVGTRTRWRRVQVTWCSRPPRHPICAAMTVTKGEVMVGRTEGGLG